MNFDRYYADLQNNSRTYEVFSLTEERSDLNVRLRADELLPSANLYANYRLGGKGIFFSEGPDDQSLQIGVDLSYPIASSQARASYERQKIDRARTALSNANKKIELKNDLRRLFYDLESGIERIALSDRRVQMANRIAESESRDYNLGKSDLNDLISALNQVDTVAQSRISAIVRQNQNTVELLRFTRRNKASAVEKKPDDRRFCLRIRAVNERPVDGKAFFDHPFAVRKRFKTQTSVIKPDTAVSDAAER